MEIDSQLEQYNEQLTDLTEQALNGLISELEFIEAATAVVVAAFTVAYLSAGGDPSAQEAAMREELAETLNSVELLADDIYSGRYSEQEEAGEITQTAERGREMRDNRLVLWVTALLGIWHLGSIYQRDAAQLKRWAYDPGKEHCEDCLALNGVVLTVAEWREMWERYGIRPQSKRLECRGFHCGCRFVDTNEPSMGLDNVIALVRGG